MWAVFVLAGLVGLVAILSTRASAQTTTCDPCDACAVPSTDCTPVDDGSGVNEVCMPSDNFNARVQDICNGLGIEPGWLLACMKFESGLSPSAVNRLSRATGLIQFLPRTAQALGTTVDALAGMSDVEQLDYVEKYMQPYAGRMNNLGDVYMSIFWPAAIGQPDEYVLFKRGTLAYTQNAGLDLDGDGTITRGEAYDRVQNIFNAEFA